MTVLHRVTWEQADASYPPNYHGCVNFFEEDEDRFVRRLVANLEKDPKVRNIAVSSSAVTWHDQYDQLVNIGPVDIYFNPIGDA